MANFFEDDEDPDRIIQIWQDAPDDARGYTGKWEILKVEIVEG